MKLEALKNSDTQLYAKKNDSLNDRAFQKDMVEKSPMFFRKYEGEDKGMTIKELIFRLNKHFLDLHINLCVDGKIAPLLSVELHGSELYLYSEDILKCTT